MRDLEIIGGVIVVIFVIGLLTNLKDILKFIKISSM